MKNDEKMKTKLFKKAFTVLRKYLAFLNDFHHEEKKYEKIFMWPLFFQPRVTQISHYQ